MVYAMKPKKKAKLHKAHFVLNDRIKKSERDQKPKLDASIFVDLPALVKDFNHTFLNPILGYGRLMSRTTQPC